MNCSIHTLVNKLHKILHTLKLLENQKQMDYTNQETSNSYVQLGKISGFMDGRYKRWT